MDDKLIRIVSNKEAEIKEIPVQEVTTNRKSNYADQEAPKKTDKPG